MESKKESHFGGKNKLFVSAGLDHSPRPERELSFRIHGHGAKGLSLMEPGSSYRNNESGCLEHIKASGFPGSPLTPL